MAWLYQDSDSQNFKVCFRFCGRSYKKSIETRNRTEAEIVIGGVNRTLFRLEQNLLELPPGGRRRETPEPIYDADRHSPNLLELYATVFSACFSYRLAYS